MYRFGLLKKYVFSKKCLFSIPIRTLCGLCVLQSLWAFYLGILAETPNPFLGERGYITGATAPSPSKDALVACQKFCTMQNQQSKQHSTPHFYIIKRFIDSLKRYIFGVPLYFWEGCGFYTGCDLNYLSNIHLLKAAIIF